MSVKTEKIRYKIVDDGTRITLAGENEKGLSFDQDIAIVPDGVKVIEVEGLFRNNIVAILPDSVELIVTQQFTASKRLRKVTMPINIRQYGGRFIGKVGRGVTRFGLFSDCPELEEVVLTGKFVSYDRNYLGRERNKSYVLDGFSIIFTFYRSPKFTTLTALGAKLTDIRDRHYKYAIRGFCKAYVNGETIDDDVYDSYRDYLEEHADEICMEKDKRDDYIIRFLMLKNMLKTELVDELLDVYDDTQIRAELMEYKFRNGSATEDDEFDL